MKSHSGSLLEVASVFLKLGVVAFGGPAAHVALMEEEIVNRRKWMDRQHFLDLMGATNLIPGPNSTEMTMHCGHERAGIPGLFVAGLAFILPAVIITGIFAWFYEAYGSLPQVEPFIMGIKPAVIVVIVGAIIKLGKKAVKNWQLGILGTAVLAASLLGVNEILALLTAGLVGALFFYVKHRPSADLKNLIPLVITPAVSTVAGSLTASTIFWSFLKVGAVLYGSGYVLFAYLDAELVSKGWLTTQQLIDAVAVGQFTPGPVLSTATFVGYQLNGWSGAMAATAGIFLPSFLFVWILNPLVPKMRSSVFLRGFLDSVNVAAVAVMVAVTVSMSTSTLVDWRAWTILAVSLGLHFGVKRITAMHLVIIGAVLGFGLSLV